MSEPFVGEIRMVGFNFAPRGWAQCNGQLLPISQNTALFALLGTTYGGDGRTTFALPDLRGRVPLHQGAGPGLSPRTLGESTGAETVVLTAGQLPSHTHTLKGAATRQDTNRVTGAALSNSGYYSTQTPTADMHPEAVAATGGSQPHDNVQPVLCVNFVIALEGIFPSRS
ncbi:tail fiber protein [Streptomyces sp. BPTC-684]|uniref:phage tail protein n=1 Tax=Streptomyces sp. BPTC-684 TaxID=3043734 RepID=UPI0024B03F1F|nr:tail fiber protein [Streptomyces sp. BPTC-684]WHM40899.1 tail fiber protein [Streptomyces sp. BPTC-684]